MRLRVNPPSRLLYSYALITITIIHESSLKLLKVKD